MREKIITLLRNNIGKAVSGEDISRNLSISRTAVWKHIQQLKNSGYDIESVYKKGYILHSPPDLLLPHEITASLKTKWLGHNIIYQHSVKSTNDTAKQAALDNVPHGTIIVAEEQKGGRGRIDRGWFSPLSQGIWFSVILRPPFLPYDAPKFTLLMAVVMAKALERYPGVKTGIKWPNDILYDDRKLVGILTEMNAQMEAINYIVIGVGVNVSVTESMLPDDIKDKATSLDIIKGAKTDRVKLLTEILKVLEDTYDKTVKTGFGAVLDEWRDNSVTLGRDVKVLAPDTQFDGKALDIDDMGALLVEKDDGSVEKVLAGDVSVRGLESGKYV